MFSPIVRTTSFRGGDGETKPREAVKLSIKAKLVETSFAPLPHLLDKKYKTGKTILTLLT